MLKQRVTVLVGHGSGSALRVESEERAYPDSLVLLVRVLLTQLILAVSFTKCQAKHLNQSHRDAVRISFIVKLVQISYWLSTW